MGKKKWEARASAQTRGRLTALTVWVAKLDQELARIRVDLQGLQHLAPVMHTLRGDGQAPEPPELLEQRLIAVFDIVHEQANGNPRALAFIMEHEDTREDELKPFLTTIDAIEKRAGFDFLHELPNSVEAPLERKKGSDLWSLPRNPN